MEAQLLEHLQLLCDLRNKGRHLFYALQSPIAQYLVLSIDFDHVIDLLD